MSIVDFGGFDIERFDPILTVGGAVALGLGRMAERPVVAAQQVIIRTMMTLCLAYDPHLLDAVVVARFLQRLKELLEAPLLILV